MNASIDFWLDELDTQVTQLSPEQLQTLRGGVATNNARDHRAEPAEGAASARSASDASAGEWPTWAGVAGPALA